MFFDPPEDVGKTITKDEPYAEVESVKAVSRHHRPGVREIVEVDEALKEAPEQINDDSTARLAGQGQAERSLELDALMDAKSYRESLFKSERLTMSHYTSAIDADRQEMLAAVGVETIDASTPTSPRASPRPRARSPTG